MHRGATKTDNREKVVDPELIRQYIAHALSFEPTIPKELHSYIVSHYLEQRKQSSDQAGNVGEKDFKKGFLYVTPRTLLGIIRLS